jgi:hypothetical protein
VGISSSQPESGRRIAQRPNDAVRHSTLTRACAHQLVGGLCQLPVNQLARGIPVKRTIAEGSSGCSSSRGACKSVFQVHGHRRGGNISVRPLSLRRRNVLFFFHKQLACASPHRRAAQACVKVMDTLISNTTSQISNTRASNRPPRRVKVSTTRCWNCGGSFIGAYLAPTAMAASIARQWPCRRWHRRVNRIPAATGGDERRY